MESRALVQTSNVSDYDIEALPLAVDETLPKDPLAQVTISDLHANALKLISLTCHKGILVPDAKFDQEAYSRLADLYHYDMAPERLAQFDRMLSEMRVNPTPYLRLIGDTCADRGSNDFLVLRVLKKLLLGKVRVEILLSNHDYDFIRNYEAQWDLANYYRCRLTDPDQYCSAIRCAVFLKSFGQFKEEMREMIDLFYKPCLRLVSYTLSTKEQKEQKGNDLDIMIYSHAGIDLEVIEGLANLLGVPYKDNTPEVLAATMHAINEKFQTEYVQKNMVGMLHCPDPAFKDNRYAFTKADKKVNPLLFLMFNRDYSLLDRHAKHPKYGYNMGFGHGHDSEVDYQPNVFLVDDLVGKMDVYMFDDRVNRTRYQCLPRDLFLLHSYGQTAPIADLQKQLDKLADEAPIKAAEEKKQVIENAKLLEVLKQLKIPEFKLPQEISNNHLLYFLKQIQAIGQEKYDAHIKNIKAKEPEAKLNDDEFLKKFTDINQYKLMKLFFIVRDIPVDLSNQQNLKIFNDIKNNILRLPEELKIFAQLEEKKAEQERKAYEEKCQKALDFIVTKLQSELINLPDNKKGPLDYTPKAHVQSIVTQAKENKSAIQKLGIVTNEIGKLLKNEQFTKHPKMKKDIILFFKALHLALTTAEINLGNLEKIFINNYSTKSKKI